MPDYLLVLAACARDQVHVLILDGPAEVRVSELGPVDGPILRTDEGSVLVPGVTEDEEVTWTLSRPGVVRFEDGRVIAEGPGQVAIGAEWEGAHAEWTLRVELHTVVWFVDPPSSLRVGDRRQLEVAARTGTTDLDIGRVAWSSSDPRIIEVNTLGTAIAVDVGTSYLTAQTRGGSAMVEVDVLP